ncbi:MAG: hypothetical protein M1835_006475 [Candelina submexicana]|nr:MAG: hypothetical protein M1835_006475 [Candelina submexicana]
MSAEPPETSPAPSTRGGLNHVLQKTLRQRHGNNASTNSIASSDAGRSSLRASIDSAVDKVKMRAKGDDEGPEEKVGFADRLSNRVRKRGKKKRDRRAEEAVIEDAPRGRSITGRDSHRLGALAGVNNPGRQDQPLGKDSELDDDKSGGSSLLTCDSEDEPHVTTPPPLTTRPSHAGYLTLSSPLINHEDKSTSKLPSDHSDSALPLALDTTLEPATAADTLEAAKRKRTEGKLSGRIRDAVSPSRRSTSPNPSPDREAAKSGTSGGLAGLFGGGDSRSESIASRRASKATENPVLAPASLQSNTSPISPIPDRAQTAKGIAPRINTVPATPPLSPTPTTTVTPPTPTDPHPNSPTSPSRRTNQVSDPGVDRKSAINPSAVASASSNMISHRRVHSASAAHPPSKLSNATSAPLTPTIEEVRTPGSQGSPSGPGGFFSTVFSAAQNAASTFSNSISNTGAAPNQSRSRPATSIEEQSALVEDSEGVVVTDGEVGNAGGPKREQKKLAVETLGMGDLSLSHLGISDASSSSFSPTIAQSADGGADGSATTPAPSPMRNEEAAAARAEDISAARAISAAYADKPTHDPNATPTAEDRGPGTRPRSTHETSIAGDQTPPNGSIFEGDSNIRRSGSVRSRIARRHRGSSAATGATIGTTLGASSSTLANATTQGVSPRLTGFAVASKKRNKDFHNLFKSVPEDDYLIEDYSAALQRDILLTGRLYVSEGHICFSSNILGWVTTLVISFDEVVSMEKKNTAVIFPNAIVIQTLHARNVFASLLARESTYDLLVGIWKISHPNLTSSLNGVRLDEAGGGDKTVKNESASDAGTGEDSEVDEEVYDEDLEDEDGLGTFMENGDGSIAGSDVGVPVVGMKSASRKPSAIQPLAGATPSAAQAISDIAGEKVAGAASSPDFPGPAIHAPTECGDSATHYDKSLADEMIAAPLGKIYSLMFGPASGAFITKFLVDEVKVLELQLEDDKKGLSDESKTRFYSYIKPLNASIGPKQTKCLTTETLDSLDLEKAVSVTVSTQTPDVPSGNVFLTKTRYCLMWAPGNSTRLSMNCTIEWTGKSWLKGPIEKGAGDGQLTYARDIIALLRSTVSSKGPRAALTGGGKAKGRGRRKKDASEATIKPDSGTREQANQPGTQQKEEKWGILTPLKGFLEPVVDTVKPLVSVNIILGTLVTFLLFDWFRRPSLSSDSAGISVSGLGTPQRIAAYEEMWRREESNLWDWLEDRIGMEGLAFPTTSADDDSFLKARKRREKALGGRKVQAKLMEAERHMNEREVDEAIRVTEERLESLNLYIFFSAAVHCDDFWGTPDRLPRISDPFNGDPRWQVVQATDTYVRFQNPNDPHRGIVEGVRKDARVAVLRWTAEQAQVDGVVNNFLNVFGSNIMLWFDGGMSAYAYAGMIVDRMRDISVQDGLADPDTVISLMLPSGKAEVMEVHPNPTLRNAQRVNAFGLIGSVSFEDYAYTRWALVDMALRWHSSHPGVIAPSGAWTTAETSDPNRCVIIDFRNFNGLTLQSDGRIFW